MLKIAFDRKNMENHISREAAIAAEFAVIINS